VEGGDHRGLREQLLCFLGCGAGWYPQREGSSLVEAKWIDAVDDDLAGQLICQGGQQCGVTVIGHRDNDQFGGRSVGVAAAGDLPRAFQLCVLGGELFGSLGRPAANHNLVPSSSKSSSQPPALRAGPAEDSDLHADVRLGLTDVGGVASCRAACMVTRSIVLIVPQPIVSVATAKM
jgi:hypothetical protein